MSQKDELVVDKENPLLAIPRNPFSSSRLILLPYLNPRNLGKFYQRYYSSLFDAPVDIRNFIESHQIPNDSYKMALRSQLVPQFSEIGDALAKDGLVILPEYIDVTQLAAIQKYYEEQLTEFGNYNHFLKQTVFSGSSHNGITLDEEMSEFLVDPFLLSLVSDFSGGNVCLSDFRGYTTEQRADILFRAWKWHHDGGREPEKKWMILLNDVEPDGGEMLFLKGTEHWWLGTKQKDANFSMEDALAISKEDNGEPRIIRCYGKAGTVIIFTGQCLHRATRSEDQTRSVLVFTLKRNVPGAAFYPIPSLAPSVADRVKDSFEGKCLRINPTTSAEDISLNEDGKAFVNAQSIKVLETMVKQEQDIPPKETEYLLEKYNATATLSSAKLRFWSRGNTSPYHFIAKIFRTDVHHDLDLIVHDSNEDVPRDVLRIRMREYQNDSLAMKRLDKRCQNINLAPHCLPDIAKLQGLLKKIYEMEMVHTPKLTPAKQFAKDLHDSLRHCDEVQDLRTNIIFIYLIYDYIHDELGIHNEFVSEQTLKSILNTYAAIVMIDDHEFERRRHISFGV
jgi:hypothetical protein